MSNAETAGVGRSRSETVEIRGNRSELVGGGRAESVGIVQIGGEIPSRSVSVGIGRLESVGAFDLTICHFPRMGDTNRGCWCFVVVFPFRVLAYYTPRWQRRSALPWLS